MYESHLHLTEWPFRFALQSERTILVLGAEAVGETNLSRPTVADKLKME